MKKYLVDAPYWQGGIAMGAVCRHYPELEVNKVQNDKKRYFCDLDAIGLATKRWRFTCTKGKIYISNTEQK